MLLADTKRGPGCPAAANLPDAEFVVLLAPKFLTSLAGDRRWAT
jgi:hypothetical protein